jgi:hypothetical protein
MGFIKLTYLIINPIISIESIVHEIEYGSTFALYHDREEVVHQDGNLKWVTFSISNNKVVIIVNDTFFHMDFFFEKFMAIFIYNLLDFGNIYLDKIDISKSSFQNLVKSNGLIDKYGQKYYKGTIFKPYYHLSNVQKIKQANMFISHGINLIKNDECYLRTKQEIIIETKTLITHIENKAHFVPNITGYINDYDFIKQLIDTGVKIFMVDFLITGLSTIFRLKQNFSSIKIWGHRIGYIVLEKYVSMQAIATLALLAGIDYLHIGTPTNKGIGEKEILIKELQKIKSDFLPIFTKTTPEVIDSLLPVCGENAIYMACGYFRNNKGEIIKNNIEKWSKNF